MYRLFGKRLLDIVFAMSVLIILSPVFLVVMILLFFFNKGAGVFYSQTRPGFRCRDFNILKFKTMTDERDANGNLLSDARRLTSLGKWLRATSLDELPQLINVIKGDMSVIGPRPLLKQYIPLYTKEQMRRHDVRPGITGWAQCHGRNDISWTQKFAYDVWYVDHLSFITDMKVFLITFAKVLKRDGINKVGHATTDPFDGSN